jgi:hypothetical protein
MAQEAKYVEGWPSTTSAWAGWSRFDIPVNRYGGVHYLHRALIINRESTVRGGRGRTGASATCME